MLKLFEASGPANAGGPALAAALFLTLLVLAQPARAATICRWVDERGRSQASDVVPQKYIGVARCSDSGQYELPPDTVRRAQARAASQARAAAETAARRPPAPAAAASVPASAASPKRPSQTVTDATDCDTWRRLYDESLACFGPYRTTRGATKAEAFERCNPIPSPDETCGPLRR